MGKIKTVRRKKTKYNKNWQNFRQLKEKSQYETQKRLIKGGKYEN